jgi:hypothetical protein
MPVPLSSGLYCSALNLCEDYVIDHARNTFDLRGVFVGRFVDSVPVTLPLVIHYCVAGVAGEFELHITLSSETDTGAEPPAAILRRVRLHSPTGVYSDLIRTDIQVTEPGRYWVRLHWKDQQLAACSFAVILVEEQTPPGD